MLNCKTFCSLAHFFIKVSMFGDRNTHPGAQFRTDSAFAAKYLDTGNYIDVFEDI